MDDKLNLPIVIYDEIVDKPTIVDTVSESIQDGKEGPQGKEGPPGKSGKSVVDKATTATINQIKTNQELQIKYLKELDSNFAILFKKIDFIEQKLSEFE